MAGIETTSQRLVLKFVEAEVRSLDDKATVLGTDVPAGAELIGNAAAEERADACILARVEVRRSEVANRRKDQPTDAAFQEGIEVPEVQSVDIRACDLLLAGMDTHIRKKAGVVV